MPKQFYVLKVASNKEEQIRDTLKQKIAIEGLGENGKNIVGRILVPTEPVVRANPNATGGKITINRKLYPGYVIVEMEMMPDGSVPEHAWYVFRDIAGVSDFISSGGEKGKAGKPIPMHDDEVKKILQENSSEGKVSTIQTEFRKGQHVKIKKGAFANFEGEIEEVYPAKGVAKVTVTIFNRKTHLEVEYWQLEVS